MKPTDTSSIVTPTQADAPTQEALQLAALQAIRAAVFHNTGLTTEVDGRVQTIRPEDHPLYSEAMRHHPALRSKPLKPSSP